MDKSNLTNSAQNIDKTHGTSWEGILALGFIYFVVWCGFIISAVFFDTSNTVPEWLTFSFIALAFYFFLPIHKQINLEGRKQGILDAIQNTDLSIDDRRQMVETQYTFGVFDSEEYYDILKNLKRGNWEK